MPLNDSESQNTQTDGESTETSPTESGDFEVSISTLSDESNSELLQRLVEKVQNLEEENEKLQSLYTDLSRRVSILESRADHLNESVEKFEIDLKHSDDDHTRKREELNKRVAALEAELGLEDWDAENSLKKPECELDSLSNMPEQMREDELSKSVKRAVIIWEHFEQWSKPVSKGQLLPSSEIRKLLSTRLDTKLEWVQVYRVMESFDANSPDEYEIIETSNSGKSLIRHYTKD